MSQPGPPLSPARQGLILGAAGLALWGLLLWPAFRLAGNVGVQGLTVSLLLSLMPGWMVLLVLGQFTATVPMAPMAASGVRLFCVGTGCVLIRLVRPDWGWLSFYLWVGLTYFPLLILETWLIVRSLPRTQPSKDESTSDNESVSA